MRPIYSEVPVQTRERSSEAQPQLRYSSAGDPAVGNAMAL